MTRQPPARAPGAVWLALYVRRTSGRSSVYVQAPTAGHARRELARRGLPPPDRVQFAGYTAERPPTLSKTVARRRRDLVEAPSHRRARAALSTYAVLRADWPTRSILHQRRYSDATLRAFLADVGAALERLPRVERDELAALVEAEAAAWYHAALELNARRAGEAAPEAYHQRRRQELRDKVRRLRKRAAVSRGLDQLEQSLAGSSDLCELASARTMLALMEAGYTVHEADRASRAMTRVTVPRL